MIRAHLWQPTPADYTGRWHGARLWEPEPFAALCGASVKGATIAMRPGSVTEPDLCPECRRLARHLDRFARKAGTEARLWTVTRDGDL